MQVLLQLIRRTTITMTASAVVDTAGGGEAALTVVDVVVVAAAAAAAAAGPLSFSGSGVGQVPELQERRQLLGLGSQRPRDPTYPT